METNACVHYNHTDPHSSSRWTARESYQYMYARPWHKVLAFYSQLVRSGDGASSLSTLFFSERHNTYHVTEEFQVFEDTKLANAPIRDRKGRWARLTFKIVVSYHGPSFDGWQKQPGLNTVQGLIEKGLGRFVDDKKAQQLRDRSLPVEGCAVVAGRTDKGVTALQQVCSFYTWRKEVKCGEIEDAINKLAPGKLRTLHITEVPRVFHPNFSAKWRRYFYVFPLNEEEDETDFSVKDLTSTAGGVDEEKETMQFAEEDFGHLNMLDGDEDDNRYNASSKPRTFSTSKVNKLLRQLEGKALSYKMFARDTKASRSIGPPTECFMFHARATESRLPHADEACKGQRVMCVELVANRFLRKMVRVLVATAIREAAAGADDDALLKLVDATCRRATAPPAPPVGLCLVDVGYSGFNQDTCLII
ncbi:tRNA pseudouridine synthase A [Dioscorea cayenensis subsp. rotundata]|uniref:tRNA pseudouridine synthase n=1 Tax=Dioscorea cayennensis subsp. rotundata TaxID=55577 RepID=A0AB40BX31_DIOCR|nr:tRNA pseudouridine synthase A [Dioscorea cayenensis subsp. rotundata]